MLSAMTRLVSRRYGQKESFKRIGVMESVGLHYSNVPSVQSPVVVIHLCATPV